MEGTHRAKYAHRDRKFASWQIKAKIHSKGCCIGKDYLGCIAHISGKSFSSGNLNIMLILGIL